MIKNRVKRSDSYLNVAGLFLSGASLTTDDFRQTLLLDGNPIVLPASNQFVLLPSEIGLQPPNFFMSVPYTGLSLYEQYLSSDYIVTGWAVFLGESGTGPLHGMPAPLTGQLYVRSPLSPNNRSPIANFYIDSGAFANSGEIYQDTLTGNQIIGLDIYSGLSGAEDFTVILLGRYNDLYEANISEGVVMSSGDSAISFFSEYGATGNTLLEYYSSNEFIANKWAVYVSNTGSSPIVANTPLTGRFYYRDPKSRTRTTITNFGITSGSFASQNRISDFRIPYRSMIGIDVSGSLYDIRNLNIVLGGQTITAANFYKDLITRFQFDIFSGYALGLISSASSGVSDLNGAYGGIILTGASGVRVEGEAWPNNTFTIVNDSGNFNTINLIPQTGQADYQEGRFYYNNDTKTYDFYLDKPDVTLNLGQEEYIRITNKTNNTIFNGTPVYISGAQGNRPTAWPALGSENYNITHLIGVATHDILDNEEGFVTTNGIVNGINTNSFNPGDILYLGETGDLTNIQPSGFGSLYAQIGYTITSQNNGKILVSIKNYDYQTGIGSGLTGIDLSNYVTKISGEFIDRPTVNGTGVLLSGESAELDLSLVVKTTGEQTISGVKNFIDRPTVNGTGVLLSGEVISSNVSGGIGNITFKNITDPSYDFISDDIGKMICFSGDFSQTAVIKTNQGFNVGDYISIMQLGTGQLTISGSGITLSSRDNSNKAGGQFAVLEVIQKNTDFWILYGDII